MKKLITFFSLLLVSSCLLLWGCTAETGSEEGTSLDFTVVSQEEIPEELKGILETNKESELMLSYKIQDYFYLVRGYGKQDSSGYSITVNGVTLMEDGIHMDTSLIGPSSGEEIPKEPSCPYVVVKIEYMEKAVIFD